MKGEYKMLIQDQNQGGKLRRTFTTDQMLRKTVLPVSAIALCVLLLIGVSACGGSHESASDAGVRPAGFTDKEWLGKQLFFDTNLSEPAGQACAACHASQVGWTGPDTIIDQGGAVYEGAVTGRFGNRKPPSSAYDGGLRLPNRPVTAPSYTAPPWSIIVSGPVHPTCDAWHAAQA